MIHDLKRWLSMLRRAAEAAPVADDVLTYQGNNQAQWRPVTGAWIDHGGLLGLADDDHTQYPLLAGRAGGQTLYGGTGAGDDLHLRPTSHAVRGTVFIADGGGVISGGGNAQFLVAEGAGANTLVVGNASRVGIGTAAPATLLHAYHATDDLEVRLETDRANGVSRLSLENDARVWSFGVWGTSFDAFVVSDATGGTYPFGIMPGAGDWCIVIDGSSRVGIGTPTPAASAKMEISSTTGALLLPRMTTAQRNALAAVDGMVIYNTTTGVVEGREGGAWVNI